MAKKKNYSKKAGGAGLMAALSDYQRENKQKETYKPKNTPKLDSKKVKSNTSQAYGSGNNFGALLKKDDKKKRTTSSSSSSSSRSSSSSSSSSSSRSSSSGSSSSSSRTPDRVSKFLGGQTVQQMLDKRKKLTDKEKAALADKKRRGLLNAQGQTLAQQRAARQAATNAAMAEKRKKDKDKRSQSGSNWAKGQLKGL